MTAASGSQTFPLQNGVGLSRTLSQTTGSPWATYLPQSLWLTHCLSWEVGLSGQLNASHGNCILGYSLSKKAPRWHWRVQQTSMVCSTVLVFRKSQDLLGPQASQWALQAFRHCMAEL